MAQVPGVSTVSVYSTDCESLNGVSPSAISLPFAFFRATDAPGGCEVSATDRVSFLVLVSVSVHPTANCSAMPQPYRGTRLSEVRTSRPRCTATRSTTEPGSGRHAGHHRD